MNPLTLGYSPCPNDTFIFYALVHGLVEGKLSFKERLEDVETLNRLVLAGELDVSKISYHLLGFVREEYCLLRSGGALGRGCGPLVIAREPGSPSALRGRKIAVPGRYTTALLLLRLFDPCLDNFIVMPFDRIMGAVAGGEADAGLIIHESRFTFQEQGLVQLLDLGEWWERETGQPIPLGGIVAKRSLGSPTVDSIERALALSVAYASAHPAAAISYIRAHSQEMSDEVCAAHIGLYVNNYSHDLGREGEAAVSALLSRGEKAGLIPPSGKNLFVA
ncbi:1,4-dihydroxy-6-naphthoate synthase [Geobacter sp. DSM 9736]|uniref:1,4-dihydroxy-6-naphthoate synthase n=1 Tax=Geobacter sp. DSM 9736 TaxID=1277350 RepID=UPI000B4FFF98|nr:1,4-dihydroxy-6-naphthoate synthase [Geobacter sp. DSM 9736]SNB47424.1 1,4-dihydroxy-6-naphthoate synthase [Geobacter sp. DSM 9736]